MEAIRRYLKVQLPRYLKGLPLPRTFAGFMKLKQDEWLYLAPLLVTIAILFYSLFFAGNSTNSKSKFRVNRTQQLTKDKVVHSLDVTDVEDLVAKGKGKCLVCRCWKSKTFPLCDGSHVQHNKETGDNVGPLVIQQKKKAIDKQ